MNFMSDLSAFQILFNSVESGIETGEQIDFTKDIDFIYIFTFLFTLCKWNIDLKMKSLLGTCASKWWGLE